MNNDIDLANYIGKPALLELTAEECVELAHACLKLARVIRQENPTPVTSDEAIANVEEEIADIDICIDELIKSQIINIKNLLDVKRFKMERLDNRIKENKIMSEKKEK